jgi:predicted ribosome quality control (RQC) complex YloA/Tae2 family protein
MHQALLQRVVEELRTTLTGRFLGKIFQLTPLSFAFDFGLRGEFLYLNADPASPRLYLIQRRTKELDKQSIALSTFGHAMRSKIGGGHLVSVTQDSLDRIVRLTFRIDNDAGSISFRRLVIQLTGRTANLFLLDELNRITSALREQATPETYRPPPRPAKEQSETMPLEPGSPSLQLDNYFSALDEARAFDSRARSIRSRLTKAIRQQRTLREHLQQDLVRHGDPETHKRAGDLLLANIATATRAGNKVRVTDYYAEGAPIVELEVDENRTFQEEAAARFRQYTKAKRAAEEIAGRLQQIDRQTADLELRLQQLEEVVQSRDAAGLERFEKPAPAPKSQSKKSSKPQKIAGVRRYLSTDGYEILVGRASRDNDNLTFKVAQPSDLWMHAGDYPGSHVVVRNPTRKEIPHRTIIEAAQLAGRFSQASEDTKVVVHYTERKFLSKPKGAAPGLVRLSRFRSITIEPKEAIPRL